mmetsp:Transcript_5171/g.12341  ORF Transcript_5171/g.12341 Transcript_5171/m.12341 type:complete len:170 (+) Transcript_5171:2332-2841(+)
MEPSRLRQRRPSESSCHSDVSSSKASNGGISECETVDSVSTKNVASLLTDFMSFYASKFDYKKEVVSLRRGYRSGRNSALPLVNLKSQESPARFVSGLNIEDPFDETRNLATTLTFEGFEHTRQELRRAAVLTAAAAAAASSSSDASCSSSSANALKDLLEPWAPEEQP